jgi:hypothetical protein
VQRWLPRVVMNDSIFAMSVVKDSSALKRNVLPTATTVDWPSQANNRDVRE